MERIIEGYFKALRLFIVLALAGMVVLVFGNVVLRYAFNTGITVSEEVARWLFVWLTFVGSVLALRKHAHLGMDSVVSRLPIAARKVAFLLSNVLMLVALWLVLKGSWQQTLINLDNKAPATGWSSGWYYGVGIFFAIAAGVLVVRNIFDVATGKIATEDLIQVVESEDMPAVATTVSADAPEKGRRP